MKKRVLLLIMVISMLVSAFVFAINSSAACTSQKSNKNIAKESNVISSSDDPFVRPELLIDDITTNGTYYMWGTFTFVFPESKQISDVRIYLNSTDTGAKAYTATIDANQNVTYAESLCKGRYVNGIKIDFLDASDQVVWSSGDVDTSQKDDRVDVSSVDAYSVKKVVLTVDGTNYGKSPIFEVKIYERTGSHDWKLDKNETSEEQPYVAADCTKNGMGTYKCQCGASKYDVIYSTGHSFNPIAEIHPDDPEKHCTTCLNGNEGKCSEEPGYLFNIEDHIYDNECDTQCNVCPATRTVEPHTYVSDCDVHCNKCDLLRAPVGGAQHNFPYNCTVECTNCREPNPNWVDHTYTSDCDYDCNFCKLERIVPPHVYTSKCAEVCSVPNCGYERNSVSDPTLIPHSYTSDCDTHCNNDNCVYVRQPLVVHPFTSKCNKVCNKCYEPNPDYVEGHFYDNDCDERCNECNQKRSVNDHRYDNNCDIDCNICGVQRTVSKHVYDEWKILSPASETSEGIRAHYCISCQKEELEPIPVLEKTGWDALSGGIKALIIVAPTVVVLGCTGIGVYSLVIKPKIETKKRLEAEEAKRKAEEEDEYED